MPRFVPSSGSPAVFEVADSHAENCPCPGPTASRTSAREASFIADDHTHPASPEIADPATSVSPHRFQIFWAFEWTTTAMEILWFWTKFRSAAASSLENGA